MARKRKSASKTRILIKEGLTADPEELFMCFATSGIGRTHMTSEGRRLVITVEERLTRERVTKMFKGFDEFELEYI